MAANNHPLLAPFWPSLCSWDEQMAATAVQSLRLAVEEQGDETPGKVFTALLRDLDDLGLALLQGSGGSGSGGGVERILGGIRMLEALVQVADGHAASSESKSAGGAERRRSFAKELRTILEGGGGIPTGGSNVGDQGRGA
ncbi:unnamed protein product, partial [Choristocarpus tenellus]